MGNTICGGNKTQHKDLTFFSRFYFFIVFMPKSSSNGALACCEFNLKLYYFFVRHFIESKDFVRSKQPCRRPSSTCRTWSRVDQGITCRSRTWSWPGCNYFPPSRAFSLTYYVTSYYIMLARQSDTTVHGRLLPILLQATDFWYLSRLIFQQSVAACTTFRPFIIIIRYFERQRKKKTEEAKKSHDKANL